MLCYLIHTVYCVCIVVCCILKHLPHLSLFLSPPPSPFVCSLFLSLIVMILMYLSVEVASYYYAVYLCLLFFRSVSTPSNSSTILLTEPA